MKDYKNSPLWKSAFQVDDNFEEQKNLLTAVFSGFRERVSHLVSFIHKDMPSLTVHDITHIDQLWWTASEIAGHDYDMNPAEAFVLGGAFLLHDAAHCIAAYPGGIDEIKKLPLWKDITALVMKNGEEPVIGSEEYQRILFDVLRLMHPKQAAKLAALKWGEPDEEPLYLIENLDLRTAYCSPIGKIAESHWWNPHELEILKDVKITTPVCLGEANWTVDVFKLAVLMRTADAAHIDASRAPKFLKALVKPGGISAIHWNFQSHLNQVALDSERNELHITGSPYNHSEVDEWWLAYDASILINSELLSADRLLREHGRKQLASRSVAFINDPENFVKCVPTEGWRPVDTSVKVSDIQLVVERFGGANLYGDDPKTALRELLQNSLDAVHACRSLGGLGEEEGEIEVALDEVEGGYWLQVTDTGVGMSLYVLTDVLLDFGRSLWKNADVNGEWEGLASSGFEAVGEFGIGFYSVLMLGRNIQITTNRYVTKQAESTQWILEFRDGLACRPLLREPMNSEKLTRHGTRVSVFLEQDTYNKMLPENDDLLERKEGVSIEELCQYLAPAIDVNLYVRKDNKRVKVISANDWLELDGKSLLKRVKPLIAQERFKELESASRRLTSIFDDTGRVIGRCVAVGNSYLLGDRGVGVVKGLLAGTTPGMAGVIFSKRQTDLVRKKAIPEASLSAIQTWAREQKQALVEHNETDRNCENMLINFGADYAGLFLGWFGGYSRTYDEFVEELKDLEEIYVYDGIVGHDYDDDVLEKEFDLEQEDILLEMPSVRVPQWLIGNIDYDDFAGTWSKKSMLKSAISAAWGDTEWNEEDVVVGMVQSVDISRYCIVIRKIN